MSVSFSVEFCVDPHFEGVSINECVTSKYVFCTIPREIRAFHDNSYRNKLTHKCSMKGSLSKVHNPKGAVYEQYKLSHSLFLRYD